MSDTEFAQRIGASFTRVVEKGEWDKMPILAVLTGTMESMTPVVFPIEEAHPVAFIQAFMELGGPAAIREQAGGGIIGVAHYSEGWVVKDPTKRAVKAFESGKKRIADEPDRIEIKMMSAFNGEEMVLLRHERGTDGIILIADSTSVDGSVPTALRALYDALVQS